MTRAAVKQAWAGLCLLALGAAAWAQTDATQATLTAISQARSRGCEGRAGVAAGLAFEPRLARAAERISRGEELGQAMRAEGFRAQRASVVSLQGSGGSALAQGLVRHACASLLDPAWQQLGIYQRAQGAWVILADPFSPPSPQDEAQVRSELLARTNQARAQARRCGDRQFGPAGPLRLVPALNRTAEIHAADMARHSFFSHTGHDGSQVAQRADRSAYAWRRIGENLAGGQTTAAAAVEGWLASPGHCANLMQPDFTEMGLAYAVNLQSSQGVYWVQVLGTPR